MELLPLEVTISAAIKTQSLSLFSWVYRKITSVAIKHSSTIPSKNSSSKPDTTSLSFSSVRNVPVTSLAIPHDAQPLSSSLTHCHLIGWKYKRIADYIFMQVKFRCPLCFLKLWKRAFQEVERTLQWRRAVWLFPKWVEKKASWGTSLHAPFTEVPLSQNPRRRDLDLTTPPPSSTTAPFSC